MPAASPILTIFMPAYNAAAYLPETVESLLTQSFRDFELLIADDGSTDRTTDIAESYARRDSRVRLIRGAHHGEVATRNGVLRAANPSSRYLLNHDSDDISLPGKLEALVGYLETHPEIAIAGTRAEYFDDNGHSHGQPPIECTPVRIRATFQEVNSMIHSASMIRRTVFETIGGYRSEFQSVDDYDFFTRALLAGFGLANIPRVLHRIRLHSASVGSTRAALQQRLAKEVQALYLQHRDAGQPTILKAPLALSRFHRTLPPSKEGRALRILFTVQMYHPQVGGSEEVVRQLSERLGARGHRVTVATGFHPERNFTQWNGVEIRQFRIEGNAVNGVRGESEAYQQFLLQGDFDVVVNYAAQIWSSDLVFPLLDRLRAAKVFVPCGYSAAGDPRYRVYFEQLAEVLKHYDRVVHLSADYRDARFSRERGLGNSLVIGNAASEEEFRSPSESFRARHAIETPYLAVCVANHYRGKGHERLIEWFHALKRNDVTLAIIGDRTSGGCYEDCVRLAGDSARIRFFERLARPDVVAAIKDADLFWFGSEVECFPLVILEAMAAGTPWLSTDAGNVRELGGGWVVEPALMPQAANTLLNSKPLRDELARIGQGQWERQYTWGRIVDQYEELFLNLAGTRKSLKQAHSIPEAKTPKVSVVIPCFNQGEYLAEAVESVLAQTLADFEVIIVNDGSTDDTEAVARRIIESHPAASICLTSQSNKGLAESRNAGIRAARGAWILPLDSDDKLAPAFLERCMAAVTHDPSASIVAVHLQEFGDSHSRIACGVATLERIAVENQINYCSLFKRSLWEQVGGYRSNMKWGYEDWDFWIGCLEGGATIAVVPEHLFLYRKRGASMFSNAKAHDAELRAQIALNHPRVYHRDTVAWARALVRLQEDSNDTSARETLARYFASRAQWREAAPHLRLLAERADASDETRFLCGLAFLQTGRLSQGRATLRRFLDRQPGYAPAHLLSAVAAAGLEDVLTARAHAEDAMELDPRTPGIFDALISIVRAEGDETTRRDLVTRAGELGIAVSDWALSADAVGDWTAPLRKLHIESTPMPLLQLKAQTGAAPGATRVGTDLKSAGPRVSVIVPTYNRPETLPVALESILKQTMQNFEVVVVNDAGADVESLVSRLNDKRVTYVRHDRNRGLAAARNTGLRLARGEYVSYLDDDDVFYPEHLAVLAHCLDTNDCAVAYTDAARAHQTRRGNETVVTHKDVPFSVDFDHDRILVGNFIPVLAVMHRRSCLAEAGMFDESLTTHEDWDLWVRLSRRYRFGHVRKVTCEFSWRVDGTSMTSRKQADFVRTLEIVYEKYRQQAADKPHVLEAQRRHLAERKAALVTGAGSAAMASVACG